MLAWLSELLATCFASVALSIRATFLGVSSFWLSANSDKSLLISLATPSELVSDAASEANVSEAITAMTLLAITSTDFSVKRELKRIASEAS